MKSALVCALAARRARVESGEDVVVGVNAFTSTEPNPLLADLDTAIEVVDPAVEAAAVAAVLAWRQGRDGARVAAARAALAGAARGEANLVPASIECARAGVTVGEWAATLREVFGEYRAPTGVASASSASGASPALERVRDRVTRTGEELGGRLRFLVGKPGLDGHSNGAEQIAVRARDAGFEVVYQGIRLTPAQIVAAAIAEDVDVVGLSILSGAHMVVVPAVLAGLRAAGMTDVPLVVGGIIPTADAEALLASGVAAVFTPRDYDATAVMARVLAEVRRARGLPQLADEG